MSRRKKNQKPTVASLKRKAEAALLKTLQNSNLQQKHRQYVEDLLRLCVGLRTEILRSPKRPKSGDDLYIILGLALKCLSHCEIAEQLIKSGAPSEAMIILRAAYEAVIRASFLDEQRSALPYYKAFAELTTLRNQLEIVKILEEFGEPEESLNEQREKNISQTIKIIEAGQHTLYEKSEDDLRDWSKLRRLTNSANLPGFEDVRKRLPKSELNKASMVTGFQVYNLGSQMTHSSYNMVTIDQYFQGQTPLYSPNSMLRQVFLMTRCVLELCGKHSILSKEQIDAKMMSVRRHCEKYLVEND